MDTEKHTKPPPATLIIRWPDHSETRHVRHPADDKGDPNAGAHDPDADDEDFQLVSGCAPYTASFNNLLNERRPNENPRRFATLAYNRMRSDGIPLNTETYNLLMGRLVRYPDSSIFDLYEQLKAEGTKESTSVQPNMETYALLFRACERNAAYHKSFLLYEEMQNLFHLTPDASTFNTLLGFCAAVQDVAQATYFVEEMRRCRVAMDSNTYNCFMSVLADTAPYMDTLDVFSRMRAEGARPTIRTYNTLLKAMQSHGDFDRGFQLYEEMKKKGQLADIVTYNQLLWLCENRLDYVLGTGTYSHVLRTQEQKATGMAAVANLAMTLLSEMESVEVEPNTFSYNKILAVLLRCEDPRFFEIYTRIESACGVTPGLQRQPSLQPSQESQQQQQQERRMSSQQASPTARSGNESLASQRTGNPSVSTPQSPQLSARAATEAKSPGAASAQDGDDAANLAKVMREEDVESEGCIRGVGVKPNLVTEKLVMSGLLLFHQAEKCKPLHLANRKQYGNFTLTRDLALILWKACEETLDREWADELLLEFIKDNLHVDIEVVNAYLSVLSATGDKELTEHFDQMKLGIHRLSVLANTQTYNIVMRGYINQNLLREGLEVYADLCDDYKAPICAQAAVSPNDESVCLAIEMLDGLSDPDSATQTVETRLTKKQALGVTVFHNLFQLYRHAKDPRIKEWFHRLHDRGDEDDSPLLPALDAECYAILMEYHFAEKEFDAIAKLFTELKTSQTLEPTTAVYRIIFHMYRAQANRKAMVAVFDDARMSSVKLDVEMYNTILETFIDTKDPFVFEVLSEMRENCIPPEDSTMALFLASNSGRQQLAMAMSNNLFYKPTRNTLF